MKVPLFTKLKLTETEQILNDAMVLPNINNGNPLHHNDDLCRHPIVILLEVVNDAAPCLETFGNNQINSFFTKFILWTL